MLLILPGRMVLELENNEFNKNENLIGQRLSILTPQEELSLNDTQNNQTLTNVQRLEYLSKLIQEVEEGLETNVSSKRLIK